jgi:hypothetical protein
MAIDSEQKRKAAASTGLPHMGVVIIPDGSFDLRDRWAVGYSYSVFDAPVISALPARFKGMWKGMWKGMQRGYGND